MHNPTQVEPVEGLARKLDHAIRLARKASPTAQVLIGVGTADRILAALKSATAVSAEVEGLVGHLGSSIAECSNEECDLCIILRRARDMLRSLSTRLAAVEAERDEVVSIIRDMNGHGWPSVGLYERATAFLARKDAEQ